MVPSSMAAAADAGDFTYAVADGKATITGYTGAGGDIIIPVSLGGYPVVAIGERALSRSASITSVIIPEGVLSIGSSGFASCTSLTSVTISDSVTSIGSSAFNYCSSLASVVIGANVTEIGDFAFWACPSLAFVDLSANVSSIGELVFTYCSSLTAINVDAGNANYASMDGVLYNKSLTAVLQCPGGRAGGFVIPGTVATIGYCSFYGCGLLTSVSIHANVTSIGGMAFADCDELVEVVVDPGNANYASMDGVLYDKALTSLIQFPGGKAGSYVIPEGVSSIGSAFRSCAKLNSLTMPGGITSIQSFAFQLCTSLTSIVIGHDVESIGAFSFWGCTSLSSVTAPDGLASIGAYAFAQNALASFTVGKNVTSIRQGAFYNCSKMTQIIVAQDNMNYASLDGVLYNKTLSALVEFPCGKAGPFIVPAGVVDIDVVAFSACALLTSVTISDNVTSIGTESFMGCSALTDVTIGRGVITIGDSTFSRCANLTSISFLGSLPPAHVGPGWLDKTSADLRGHAYAASGFPGPGSDFHGLVMGTVIPVAPDAPTNLTASVVNAKAVLAWAAPSSGPVANYNIYRSGGANDTYAWIASSSATNYTDAKVAAGQTYWYKVSGNNSAGEGAKSAAVSVNVPAMTNNDAAIILGLVILIVLLLLALIARWNSSKGRR
jgi:hypothetical protein